jgi:hypothetical protein
MQNAKHTLLAVWLLLAALFSMALRIHEDNNNGKVFVQDPGNFVLAAAFASSTMMIIAAGLICLST